MLFSQLLFAATAFSMSVASLDARAETRNVDLSFLFSNKLDQDGLKLTNAVAKSGEYHAYHVNGALTPEQIAYYTFPPGDTHSLSISKTVYPANNQYLAVVEGSMDIFDANIEKAIAHLYFYANSTTTDYIFDVSDVVDGYKVTQSTPEGVRRHINVVIEN